MVSNKEIKEKYQSEMKRRRNICPECETKNPKGAEFCQECGSTLKNKVPKTSKSNKSIENPKKWWNEQNSGVKIISIVGVSCIGLLLLIAVAGFLSPDKNLTTIKIDDVISDGPGEAHVYINNNTTEYEIKGSTESNATITVSSNDLNKNNETIPLDVNNKFSYKVSVPSNVSEFKIKFDASKTGKKDSYIEVSVKKEEPKIEQTSAPQTSTELNSDVVKSIIGGGSEIKSIDVQNGAVRINYELGAIWDEDQAVLKTSDDAIEYMKKLFQDSRVNSVTVASYGTFTDAYGNDKEEMVVKITINKETANKINWEGISELIYTDKGHLLKVSDSYSINPSIYKELTFYVPISK